MARDLRTIYRPPTVEAAEQALIAFEDRVLDDRIRMTGRKWCANWDHLTAFLNYPPELRKVIYTSNAIEALNAQLTKVTKKRGAFPTPESIRKVLYLAILKDSERWTRPVKDWNAELNHMKLVFPGEVRL